MCCVVTLLKCKTSLAVYPQRWWWKLWSREVVSVRLMLLFCWVPHHTVLEVSATSKSQATLRSFGGQSKDLPWSRDSMRPCKRPSKWPFRGGSCRTDKQQRPQTHKRTSWSSCSGKAPIEAFLLCSYTAWNSHQVCWSCVLTFPHRDHIAAFMTLRPHCD